jgi:hypothetical protein
MIRKTTHQLSSLVILGDIDSLIQLLYPIRLSPLLGPFELVVRRVELELAGTQESSTNQSCTDDVFLSPHQALWEWSHSQQCRVIMTRSPTVLANHRWLVGTPFLTQLLELLETAGLLV